MRKLDQLTCSCQRWVIEPLPLKNARLLPQQSVLVFCNVPPFERVVKTLEEEQKAIYFRTFQLVDNPAAIPRDLRIMGVYAASLFPGLDGICRIFAQRRDASLKCSARNLNPAVVMLMRLPVTPRCGARQ